MSTLPRFDVLKNRMTNPHVVILGAGASKAACPNGDKNGILVPIMNEFQDIPGLYNIISDIESIEGKLGNNFEDKYSMLTKLKNYNDEEEEINRITRNYFSRLELPDTVTVYDLLILGLREKDSIFTFNWDPFLLQALNRCSGVSSIPQVHFLHGCVDVGLCHVCKVKTNSYLPCPKCGEKIQPSRLLFPVADKDYNTDPVIKDEWNALQNALSDAYFVTIFGYSAPVTDKAARKILIETFSNNRFRECGEVEVIDTNDNNVIEDSWREFFVSNHYGIYRSFNYSQIKRHFRRSCEAYFMAVYQCDPVPENKPEGICSVAELKRFTIPLNYEEKSDQKFWGNDDDPIIC